MKRLLSVKEFSMLSGIEKTTLRYWDEKGLFSPVVRDAKSHYRYYSSEQLASVSFIVFMSKLSIPLKTIQAAGLNKTPGTIIRLLEEQERKLDLELRKLHELYSVIHERLSMIRYGAAITRTPYDESFVPDITVRQMPEGRFTPGPRADICGDVKFNDALLAFRRQAEALHINLSYPVGSCYRSMDAFADNPDAPDNFFSSDPNGSGKWPRGNYLTGYSRGCYGDFGNTPEKMRAYAISHNLTLTGPVFQIYLHDEICVNDPSRYLAQFSVLCK